MFKKAVLNNKDSVVPFVTSYKTCNSDDLISTVFPVIMINKDGWALTTKSIANNIVLADKIHEKYEQIKKELIENKVPPKKIYKKYNVKDTDALIMKNVFLNSVTKWDGLKIYAHDTLDLAVIKFENPEEVICKKFPIFRSSNPCQGESICRLGYPYTDLKVFRYDHSYRDIVLSDVIDSGMQIMPLDGMVTRYLTDESGNVSLFEMSGPSFINHNGSPVLDKDGYIVGLQLNNAYKDTMLDMDLELKRQNDLIKVKQYNFIPFSIGINVSEIIKFLDKYNIKYETK